MLVEYETCKNGYYERGIMEISKKQYDSLLQQKNGDEKMSVPAYERKISSVDYLAKGLDLLKFTVFMCSKMSNKYTFMGKIKTYEYAQTILDNCLRANRLDVKIYFKKRKEFLDLALCELSCLSCHLEMVLPYVKFMKYDKDESGKVRTYEDIEAKERAFVKWSTLIEACENLIKGVKESDVKRNQKNNMGV